MKAFTHTPADIFGHQIRYVVPLFQRPYVWNEIDQWQPLWDDVSTLAERVLDAQPVAFGMPPVAPHFLGAIVVEQQLAPVDYIASRHVIDGQQRLTTMQLLLDAAHNVTVRHGMPMDAQALDVLVLNNRQMAPNPDHVFKVWPTDRDQAAFRAAMDDDTVVPKELIGSNIAQGHAFFVQQVEEWADIAGDAEKSALRLAALGRALRDHLRVVVIDLEPGDNAQVIFETLNHRGSPLLAADLMKNLVFQVATQQGLDVAQLYKSFWAELDTDYWRKEVTQGRFKRPRIDVFLNRWLTMKLLREVQVDRVFAEFRDHLVQVAELDIASLLAELSADAEVHRSLEQLSPASVEGRFYYRVLVALDTQVIGPFLIWILRHDESLMPIDQRHKALESFESWLVRRALCRATTKEHNKMVLDLLQELVDAGPAVAGDTTERVLSQQGVATRYWPNDEAVAKQLAGEAVYKNLTRPRLRMVLEALEDLTRGEFGEGQQCPRSLTIEHVMPQGWREHWGADIDGDEVAGWRRDQLVQTLGNLTLVNEKLNPALSNRPWTTEDAKARELGNEGKRDLLLKHSQLSLNASLVHKNAMGWTESEIQERTSRLVADLCAIWPCPPGAAQPTEKEAGEASRTPAGESQMQLQEAKYAPLSRWLRDQGGSDVRLTFAEIEEILGSALPDSARKYPVHWRSYAGSALARGIQDAGWRTQEAMLPEERVVLERSASEEADEDEGSFVSGADAFIVAIEQAPLEQQAVLHRLAEWAQSMEEEGLCTLGTYFGARGEVTLLPRLVRENVGLVTIWNWGTAAPLQFWKSVFDRRAIDALEVVNAALVPNEVTQGGTTRDVTDELLAVLTEAYREASGNSQS